MSLDDDINRFFSVALFADFPEEQLRLLAFGSKRIFLRKGEFLYHEGAMSDGGYIVVSGQVDLLVMREGREIILASQLENSVIGEMAMITANKRVADALARTDCELLHVPRDVFKRMLGEYPELALLMHGRIFAQVQQLLSRMGQVEQRLHTIPPLTTGTREQG